MKKFGFKHQSYLEELSDGMFLKFNTSYVLDNNNVFVETERVIFDQHATDQQIVKIGRVNIIDIYDEIDNVEQAKAFFNELLQTFLEFEKQYKPEFFNTDEAPTYGLNAMFIDDVVLKYYNPELKDNNYLEAVDFIEYDEFVNLPNKMLDKIFDIKKDQA